MDKVNVLGVLIDPLRLEQALVRIRQAAQAKRRLLMAHANIRALNLACEQPWLRTFFNRADLVFCDGMGVMLGARFLGCRLPERFTLADWIWPLAEMAAAADLSLFLLGNPPGVAERAAERLQGRYVGLRVAGVQHGFFNQAPGQAENEAVIARINAARPDILLVGFGMPVQERWLAENWPRLEARVAITGGAIFEYVVGDLPRGPDWMTQHYLEWLARALISPGRYSGRYLRDIPLFLVRVLRQRLGGSSGFME
jgi:N-acetylglucosaminyldiphosphoundecaprenol N-acetyl-beta-D-mannosaminyltransferase